MIAEVTNLTYLQMRTRTWLRKCLGGDVANDKIERACRFVEEVVELAQACGMTKEQVTELVDYTYERPVGELSQEVGGVMITLAALCGPYGVSLSQSTIAEFNRINTPEAIENIRQKQATKPHGSPLPGKADE